MRIQKQLPKFSNQARKFLGGLDFKAQQRLKKAIEKIPEGDITPYRRMAGYLRLRIGDYRIIFTWLEDERIYIVIINFRGKSYKMGV
ncbi:MAG: type II toxin-antitoxin system RelE/ParE family toxin [Defluviitaleaceae bacterium]|nr:type II toxin-antitoxin system RelE/ParE family toxin [Defluviitaleaceae bacterium]